MATYNPSTRYWTLDANEVDFALPAGTTTDNIRDNALSNRLTGDDGSNQLEAHQGGADTLVGGKGDERYWIALTDTVIIEHDGEGIDEIYLDTNVRHVLGDISYTIPDFVEKFWLDTNQQNSIIVGNDLDVITHAPFWPEVQADTV